MFSNLNELLVNLTSSDNKTRILAQFPNISF